MGVLKKKAAKSNKTYSLVESFRRLINSTEIRN